MLIYKKLGEASLLIRAVEKKFSREIGGKIRSIDDVYDGVHEAMAQAGVFSTTEIKKIISERPIKSKSGTDGTHMILEIEFTFYAEDGSNVKSVIWGEGRGYDDKTVNKCLSAAHKYCLTQLFTIPVTDTPDPDKEACEEACEVQTIDEKLQRAVSSFASLNVSPKQLECFIAKPLRTSTEADYEAFKTLYKRLSGGESFADIMASKGSKAKVESLMDKIKAPAPEPI